jgi:hypothetical protein
VRYVGEIDNSPDAVLFPDQAMTLAAIDRLVHHPTILEMNVRELQAPRRPRTQARLDPGSRTHTHCGQG